MKKNYLISSAIFLLMHSYLNVFSLNVKEVNLQEDTITSSPNKTSKTNDLFATNDILEITIKTNYKILLKDRGENRRYHSGTVNYVSNTKTTVSLPVKIEVRGNYRRKIGNCGFPPLRLKFASKKTKNTIFKNHKHIKLITHCQSKKSIYENYMLQEYLVYKVYNMLTDTSFRVRLAKITYIDTKNQYKTFTKYGFFLERPRSLVKRFNGKHLKVKNIHPEKIDRRLTNLMSIFQYMIGNTDWSVKALHNIKLIALAGGRKPLPVPYDFDFCGVINSPYAVPAPELGLNSVRERYFNGYPRKKEELAITFAKFNKLKGNIYSLYRNFSPLNEKEIKRTLKYYDEFYKTINNPRKSKTVFINNARIDK